MVKYDVYFCEKTFSRKQKLSETVIKSAHRLNEIEDDIRRRRSSRDLPGTRKAINQNRIWSYIWVFKEKISVIAELGYIVPE